MLNLFFNTIFPPHCPAQQPGHHPEKPEHFQLRNFAQRPIHTAWNVIRFAPPLVISRKELNVALRKVKKVFKKREI